MRCFHVPLGGGSRSGCGLALSLFLGLESASPQSSLACRNRGVESDRRFHIFVPLEARRIVMANGGKPHETKETPPKDQGTKQGPKQSGKGTK